MDNAFKYVVGHPLETEAEYPYLERDENVCNYDKSKGVGKITGYTDVTPNSVEQLKAAIARGPVSVAIEADQSVFQMYTGGVLNSPQCGKNLDHGVLAVGYGEDKQFGPYFKVKNSWGPGWGDKGYIRIAATSDNICGILSQPSYPLDATTT